MADTVQGMPSGVAMSSNSLDVVHRFYDALATNDGSNVMPLLTDDFLLTVAQGMPNNLGGVYHGPTAANVWVRIWSLFAVQGRPTEFLPLDDNSRFVVLGAYLSQSRDDGSPLEARFAHVVTVRGDRLAAFEQITDTAQWALFAAKSPRSAAA